MFTKEQVEAKLKELETKFVAELRGFANKLKNKLDPEHHDTVDSITEQATLNTKAATNQVANVAPAADANAVKSVEEPVGEKAKAVDQGIDAAADPANGASLDTGDSKTS